MRTCFPFLMASLGLVTSFAATAGAHIRLLSPAPRYEVQGEVGIKSCPCGLGGSNRVCDVARDGSDDDRSTRVTRLEAGSTVTLRFEEFVDHAGRFRVAFDPEGADMADFNANILDDISDPRGTGGQVWEMEVTLPDMICDNCTLQLVQAMEVDVNTPVADPAPISSYYSCVDLELVAPGALDDAPGDGQPGDGEPGDGEQNDSEPGDDLDMGEQTPAPSDDAPSGANAAGEASGTPLIPAGSGTPTDTGSSGSAAPSGEVAMNDVANGAPGSLGSTLPLPPNLGGSESGSEASGGCGLGQHAPSGAALGAGLLGLLAVLGLGRRAGRTPHPRR